MENVKLCEFPISLSALSAPLWIFSSQYTTPASSSHTLTQRKEKKKWHSKRINALQKDKILLENHKNFSREKKAESGNSSQQRPTHERRRSDIFFALTLVPSRANDVNSYIQQGHIQTGRKGKKTCEMKEESFSSFFDFFSTRINIYFISCYDESRMWKFRYWIDHRFCSGSSEGRERLERNQRRSSFNSNPSERAKKREKYHVEKLRQWIRGFGKIKIEIRICAEKRENDMNEARIYVVFCAELIFNELYVKREKLEENSLSLVRDLLNILRSHLLLLCLLCSHVEMIAFTQALLFFYVWLEIRFFSTFRSLLLVCAVPARSWNEIISVLKIHYAEQIKKSNEHSINIWNWI